MSLKKMSKDELELMSNKDITYLLLEERAKPINTLNLFKKIAKLLELPESTIDSKIADYYTALATDKRFIMLEDGSWDLRSRHTSDKVIRITEEDDEDEIEENEDEESEDDIEEDNYDDTEDEDYDEDTNEELKDLVVIDEDELELEQ